MNLQLTKSGMEFFSTQSTNITLILKDDGGISLYIEKNNVVYNICKSFVELKALVDLGFIRITTN